MGRVRESYLGHSVGELDELTADVTPGEQDSLDGARLLANDDEAIFALPTRIVQSTSNPDLKRD